MLLFQIKYRGSHYLRLLLIVLLCLVTPFLLVATNKNPDEKGIQETSSKGEKNDLIDINILFPRGFGIAVNQVGYMQGSSLDATGGPWRAGIRRNFDVRDYEPMAEVGKAVGVRFMSLFALAEMDRLNVVATLPHATQGGHNFDNSHNISNTQIEIMDFVKENASFIELGVTGVGHEWWVDSIKTRSEWYDLANKQKRPDDLMVRHMNVIKNILGQYGISEANGHTFPESFSALGFHWNPSGPFSSGKLFSDYGVKYANTKFYIIPELNPPPQHSGGFDHGLLVLDREGYGNLWHAYAALPDKNPALYETDLIESHWANWLAEDDFLQPALNQEWIQYFRNIQAYPYRYLAKNTEQLYSQWLYHEYATVSHLKANEAIIDNSGMPEVAYRQNMLGNMVLSVPLEEGYHIQSATINGQVIASVLEESGFGFIYLPVLNREKYTVTWEIGQTPLQNIIHNTGTYVVYNSSVETAKTTFKIKMYGTQNVHFRVEEGYKAVSESDGLTVQDQFYDTELKELVVRVSGRNIQGETGKISLIR